MGKSKITALMPLLLLSPIIVVFIMLFVKEITMPVFYLYMLALILIIPIITIAGFSLTFTKYFLALHKKWYDKKLTKYSTLKTSSRKFPIFILTLESSLYPLGIIIKFLDFFKFDQTNRLFSQDDVNMTLIIYGTYLLSTTIVTSLFLLEKNNLIVVESNGDSYNLGRRWKGIIRGSAIGTLLFFFVSFLLNSKELSIHAIEIIGLVLGITIASSMISFFLIKRSKVLPNLENNFELFIERFTKTNT